MPPPPALAAPSWMSHLGHYGLPAALGELMWIGQVELEGYGAESLVIYGTVRPPYETTRDEWHAFTQLSGQLGEILDVLDQAGITLIGFPDMQVSWDNPGVKMDVRLKVWDTT